MIWSQVAERNAQRKCVSDDPVGVSPSTSVAPARADGIIPVLPHAVAESFPTTSTGVATRTSSR